MSDLDTAGAITSILGAILGGIAIWITIKIYRKVKKIEDTRRKDQRIHFKTLIQNNVEEIAKIYQSITILSHRESFSPEELEIKTKELQNFFKKNQEYIMGLIRDTKFYTSMLSVVDTPTIDMNQVIDKLKWLTEEFYILDYPIERAKLHWVGKEKDLQDNKDFIDGTLSSLNKS